MNNDLISREDLKNELAKCGYDIADFGGLFFIIDNAPTVLPKYFPPCEDCNKKMEEIRQAYDKMKAMERPKGEWIVGEYMDWHCDILPKYTCPFCGEVAYRKYDFCHCGADMRGGNTSD